MRRRFSKISGIALLVLLNLNYRLLSATDLGKSDVATVDTIEKDKKEIMYIPDTVFLKNEDRITGKIISFEQGRLSIDAQGPGIVSIKWYKIITISGGSRMFKLEDTQGTSVIGHIGHSTGEGELLLMTPNPINIKLDEIGNFFPLEQQWYRRIKGSLGAGVNYTRSSEVLTVNADYNIYYDVSKWRFGNDFSFISTSTEQSETSLRTDFSLNALYSLPNRWVLSEANSYQRNDELGIRSRISFGAGLGNDVVQTEIQRLLLLSGIVVNLERDANINNVSTNWEWPFSVQHTIYSFLRPNISSTTSITTFVGITDKGRERIDASTSITWEFINNVNLKFSFYYNYDNKTIEEKITKYDYGTVLSLVIDLK